jgi:hypothetical protein
MMGCGNSRQVSSEVRRLTAEVRVDSVVVGTMEVVHDTIVETTIITVDRNEVGDTLFRSVVTDRTKAKSRDHIAAYKTKTVIKTDTVFVERRDSVLVKNTNQARASPFENTLKWGVFIVLALIGLILLLRIRR